MNRSRHGCCRHPFVGFSFLRPSYVYHPPLFILAPSAACSLCLLFPYAVANLKPIRLLSSMDRFYALKYSYTDALYADAYLLYAGGLSTSVYIDSNSDVTLLSRHPFNSRDLDAGKFH